MKDQLKETTSRLVRGASRVAVFALLGGVLGHHGAARSFSKTTQGGRS